MFLTLAGAVLPVNAGLSQPRERPLQHRDELLRPPGKDIAGSRRDCLGGKVGKSSNFGFRAGPPDICETQTLKICIRCIVDFRPPRETKIQLMTAALRCRKSLCEDYVRR